jgi:hypothetical protein
MSHKKLLSVRWGLLLAVVCTGLPISCGVLFSPPAAAVLAGTWELTTPSTASLTQLLLTFDQNGNLTTVTYKLGTEITVTESAPVSTTTVDGKNVTISATFLGNSLDFNGTLNEADTVITGTLSTRIALGTIVITIDGGPGTMTKL